MKLMKYKGYLKKAKIFMSEAIIDIDNMCYSKAISALWFMIESLYRAILNYYKQPIPSRSEPVISKIIRFIKG